ncbi:winged helix-turn-helix transcriptional regulator [archaeon]|nr:winged helix-turn-helix transcriptional regulator [archaeon]
MINNLGNVLPLEETEAYNKIINWFFSYPQKEIGLSELSKELNISKMTANRYVNRLVDEKYLRKEVLGRIWRISCNLEHVYNFTHKISYNLNMVYKSGILLEIHKIIPNSRAIVLFGSYRKGDDTEKSDIDIAVEVLDDEDLRIVELGVLPQLGYRKNVLVNLHVFSRNKVDLNLFSNIANGIVLEGFLEVHL